MINKLAAAVRDLPDPYKPEYFTHLEVFVVRPTAVDPYPCLLVSIRNGHKKLFFRVVDLSAYDGAFRLSPASRKRLRKGLALARRQAAALIEARRLDYGRLPDMT
ncbi:MAG: hypothetical protein HYY29_04970 [Chloroflexi bacterium]|nr:hypothetical protein [Chloroflexota bacterium]